MNALIMTVLAATVFMSPEGNDKADGSKASPVKSLARALELVRSVEREEAHEIVVGDGFYAFEKPVELTGSDYDITIRAEHRRQAVFSGAAAVTNWKTCDDDSRFLEAELPFEPTAGSTYTMICNGNQMRLARYPGSGKLNYDTDKSSANFITPLRGALPDGVFAEADLKSLIVVVPQEYSATMTTVKECSGQGGIALSQGLPFDPKQFNHGFYLLNAKCGMTEPGCWMYEIEKKRMLYYPREGETADNFKCSIARSHGIISDRYSHGTRLIGLVFEGCIKEPPNAEGKEEPLNCCIISAIRPDHWLVKDCEFRCSAGTGMFLVHAVHSVVDGCYVHDLGSNGVDFYDGGEKSVIRNCEITRIGQTQPSSFGVGFQITDSECVSNHIHHVPGNGISAWATLCVFASNDLHHCMQSMSDGGGLYGGATMCTMKDNYVHDTRWAGLYVDEGSFRDLYVGNVFENIGMPIHIHNSQYVTVSNNVFRGEDMYFSFQGSGHCRFEYNRIYTPKKITEARDLASCDFWGNNEQFVKDGDGFKSLGDLSFPRVKVEPYTLTAVDVSESKSQPISQKDAKIEWGAFTVGPGRGKNCGFGLGTAEDGYLSIGVPGGNGLIAFDQYYLYLGVRRTWNVLGGYPGWKNFESTGWKHCDAVRFDFEGGKHLICYPNGKWETNDRNGLKLAKDDVFFNGDGGVLRLPLEALEIRGASKGKAKIELAEEGEGDDMLLTDDAMDEMKGPDKNLPKPQNVVGLEIKFNAQIWVEDMRESKSVFPRKGEEWATGTLKFGEKVAVETKKGSRK